MGEPALTAPPRPDGQDLLASSTALGGRFRFDLLGRDPASFARRGRITTTRGRIETPDFMPVGTQAAVKCVTPDQVAATGAQVVLANTYHLMLRPGVELLRDAGGVQRFMGWPGPMLTDSGGFQIFSLAANARVTEEGVTFRSHIDGAPKQMTPESIVALQMSYGSDIMMQLDHLVGLPAERSAIKDATDRSLRWLERAIAAYNAAEGPASRSVLFGIQQGGMEEDLRIESAQRVGECDVAGCAVGGLSVGEPKEVMAAMLEISTPHLPADKPRYLMGVGSPEDLWDGVARGIDMFDCVLPTRAARNGGLYTPEGRITITNARFRRHFGPVDPTCDCLACTQFTAAYIHHLFRAGELLGLRLASIHNLRFLARIMADIRAHLDAGAFAAGYRSFRATYRPVGDHVPEWRGAA